MEVGAKATVEQQQGSVVAMRTITGFKSNSQGTDEDIEKANEFNQF